MTQESPMNTRHPEVSRRTSVATDNDAVPGASARRRFLQMIGAGAAGAAGLAAAGPGVAAPRRTPWGLVQARFSLNPDKLFMNIGTAGAMPREVVRFFDNANKEYARESLNGYGSYGALRERIAPGFGVDPDELVVSANTSDGMCHAILGIPWQAGDCVVTTNHEHPGGNVPLQIAVDRYGIVVRRVLLPVGNDQTAADYEDLFQEGIDAARAEGLNVRAIMWSSPTFISGTMLPIRRLVDVAIRNGLVSICDGAHLPGMMAYDYAKLGVDFMAGAGHKWQCGPGSTGILVIRNKVRAQYNPLPLTPYFPVVTSSYAPTIGGVPWTERATGPVATFDIAAVLQSCGSKHAPLLNALGAACDFWDEIGRANIEDYVLGLSARLKEAVARFWGADLLYSPKDDPELVSALTSFNPFYYDPSLVLQSSMSGTFVNRLRDEYGIIIRNTSAAVRTGPTTTVNHYPLRVSTHLWHDAADVDRFVNSAFELATRMRDGT
jgi:selenocysteine lyase/cysteine desulfurase